MENKEGVNTVFYEIGSLSLPLPLLFLSSLSIQKGVGRIKATSTFKFHHNEKPKLLWPSFDRVVCELFPEYRGRIQEGSQ